MSEDLLSYLNAYNLDEVYLIGHSMGGKVAMTFACLYAERVEKLVVVDIAPKYYPRSPWDTVKRSNFLKYVLLQHPAYLWERKNIDFRDFQILGFL